PIPTKDYYSLYGVFASSQEPKELPLIAPHAKIETYQIYDTELKTRQDAAAKFQETNKKALMMGDAALKTQLAALQSRVDDWKKTAPPEPERAMVMEDAPVPVEPVVFKRGNPSNPGDKVPRQFLEILSGPDRKPFQHGSGRLDLAEAIANGANPLTARVMVNRIWLHHFGSGLVRTPSDFGMRSDPPTHPELLDYLASRFVQDGWSIKKMHRLILLSSVYEESSDGSSLARQQDPENLLLSHMNRQRLDFEALHDSLLAASARLDSTAGGPSVDIVTAPFSHRRAVYGSIDRQNLPSLFRTFDFANPDMHSPQRHVTTVPQQALFMMNSPFVVEQAQQLAARPEVAGASEGAGRIGRLYRLLFGRSPTAREVQLGLHYLNLASLPLPGNGPDQSTSAAWQYGYGEYDEATGRVKTFQPLGHWTGMVWQVGDVFPDPKLGYLLLNPSGGHPGNDLQHAIIRRWTAPADGAISISGTLSHGQKEGDGVQGRIVSSRLGDLGHWVVHNSAAETNVPSAAVTRGDTIDFVLDCRTGPNSDSFGWAPIIRLVPKGPGTDSTATEWNASNDFSGPAATSQKPLGPWEKYAQVLLMTNEFAFVD
ncbi:MAG: DUF1553 domain-containing protein, partial [Armatimonadota bacterium]|nr:DUF1553 domain-containing protein [Armatimonadota bacterium]